MPSVYTVQLFIPHPRATKIETFDDIVRTEVYLVRAIGELDAVNKVKAFADNPAFTDGRADKRDARYWNPEDLKADIVFVQNGFMDPKTFAERDRKRMMLRIKKQFRKEADNE